MFVAEAWIWELEFRLFKFLDNTWLDNTCHFSICSSNFWCSSANHVSHFWWARWSWTFFTIGASPERWWGSHVRVTPASCSFFRMKESVAGLHTHATQNLVIWLRHNLITAKFLHKKYCLPYHTVISFSMHLPVLYQHIYCFKLFYHSYKYKIQMQS